MYLQHERDLLLLVVKTGDRESEFPLSSAAHQVTHAHSFKVNHLEGQNLSYQEIKAGRRQ